MNKVYKVIWNRTKQCYIVVSEFAKQAGKVKSTHLFAAMGKTTVAVGLGVALLFPLWEMNASAATGNKVIGGSQTAVKDAEGKTDQAAATGDYSTVSGGYLNHAEGDYSSVSGGEKNTAVGKYASVSGGGDNQAFGEASSISGGMQNTATGEHSSVTGGAQSQAAGQYATISGGTGNKAFGYGSIVLGGTGNVVGKMAVDESGNPKFKDSKGNDVVGTMTTDKEGNPIFVDSEGNIIKDANPYSDPNSFAGSVAVAIGGMSSSVQGGYSVGIAGGSTSESAWHSLAAGNQATVTVANGVAIGYESTASVIDPSRTADTQGRIVSFGHKKGDTYYTVDYQNHTVTENKYDSDAYNRLVNVADGIDDHDVVVMEQLKNAKAEAVAEAKTNIKVKGDEKNIHAEESTDSTTGVQTTTISLLPKVTLKESTDTTGAKQVVLDGTAGTISAGLSTDAANYISLDGTKGLAQVGAVKIGKQTDGNDTTKSGNYVTGLDNKTWTVGQTQPVTGRAATEDQLKSVSDVVNSNKTQITTNTNNIAKGLNFSASNKVDGAYKTVKKNLGDTVAVRANDAQKDHTYKTDNLTTEIDDTGIITVKMDTQLTADKVTVGTGNNAITLDGSNGNVTTGSSTLGGTGLTIINGPSVTTSGISGGSKQITKVKSGASRYDDSNNPVYGIDTNAANIGDVKNIAAKTVTVSGDGTNTKVDKTTAADGTVDYKVSLNDSVTLGSDAGTQVSMNGKTGVIKAGNQATIDGSAGTASIGNLSLGTVAANTLTLKDKDGKDTTQKADAGTYATGLTNTTWDVANPSYVSGRAATEDELLTVSNTVNSGWKAQIDGKEAKTVTPTDNTLNFVAGDNISLSSGKDIKIATTPDVNFTTVRVGGTNTSGTYTGGIFLGNQAGGGANGSADSPIMSITGLKNTAWVKDNFMSGRAATEDQLNAVAQQIKGEVNAADIYVESGSVSYDTKGDGTGTLQRSNKTTGNLTGLHDYYVTGGSVSHDGKTLNLTKNGGGVIPGIDLTSVLNQDSHLVAADSGEYTVGSDGKVTLKVKNNAAGSTPTDVVISGIASNAALQQGLKFKANTAEAAGGSDTYKAQLGGTVSVLGGTAKNQHTYNTDNITTTMDNGTITVKLDNDLTANSLTAGSNTVDGRVKVTGATGAYVEMDGSDGSIHLGNNGGRYSALYQNYGGKGFLTSETSPRLEYAVDNAPNTRHTIATLDDGMKFAGDDAKNDSTKVVSRTLNSTLNITGGAATGTLTDNNIGVVKNGDDGLAVKLNKDLTDMGTISFAPTETGKQGIKIGSQTIANNGTSPNSATGDYITGLTNTKWSKDGIVSGRAATEDQLQQVAKSIVNGSATGGGFGLSADNADSTKAKEVKQDLGSSIKITTGGDTNLSTQADSANKAIVVSLNKELNLTKTTLTDGTTGATTVVDGNGVVITPKQGSDADKVKLTTDGLSNGGKQITNVLSGLNGTELVKAEGDTLKHAATIGDLQAAAKDVMDGADAKGLNFEGNTGTKIHTNLGDTLKIQGTGAADRDYDGGANVRVVADNTTNTLTVQLDRDLDAHTMTLGKESTKGTAGEFGTLKINGQNKDGGISPVSINATYTDTAQDTKTALKTAMSRITYDGGNSNSHTVATLDDGLQLSGDNGETANTTLNKKVTIKGGVTKDKLVDNTTDSTKNNNIGVVASQDDDGNTTLSLQLAKDITGLNTVTAGTVVMGNQSVVSEDKVPGSGNFVTGLDNKTWDGKDFVSGRAATEDQLKTVSDSIRDTVGKSTFALTAGGQGEATDATITKKVGESIRIFGDAPKVSGSGDGDGWDRSKANILTKVKKDNHGDSYVSVELQDHLEVGVHGDGKTIEGTDGSMQFKGKSAKEVNITGDKGVTLSDNGNETAALRQDKGAGYLDLTGTTAGTKASVSVHTGAKNLAQQDQTRLTYTDQSSKVHDVATMDDGLVVAGDNGQVTRLLNSTLKLSGGEKDETKLSNGQNIGVVANKDKDGLDIKLAKDLTDIDSITMTGGLTLNSTNGSSTITGLTNTSVDLPDFGKAGRAATEEQLQQVKDGIANATKGGGFGLADDKGNAVKADLGSNIGLHGDGNITTAVSNDGKSLNIGLKKDVDLGKEGSIKAGGVTIDNKGIDAGGKNITNVKSGIVKGDDSDNTNAANIGDVHTIVDNKVTAINNNVSDIKNDVDVIKKTGRTYQGDDKKTVKVDFAEGKFLSLTGGANDVSTANNIGVMANGENGLAIRLAKKLNGLESVTTGKTTMDDNGLTIAGSDGKTGTTVTNSGIKIASGGDGTHAVEVSNSNVSMGGQQIHDVAPGTAATDAVNVSQLSMFADNVGGAINKLDNRVNRVGAGAAALAALHPLDFDPDDKWDFAAGFGNYKNANAAAIGAYYRPNEDTMFSVGGSFGGGENMVNAGISFKLGQGNHVSTSRVAMGKEILDLRKVVAKQDGEIQELKQLVNRLAGQQVTSTPVDTTKLFPDIPRNHWAYVAVHALAEQGILTGYPNGNFEGDRMMTRYEFAEIVYKAMQKGLDVDEKLVNEFEPELSRIRVDVIAKDAQGNPTIERVRVK